MHLIYPIRMFAALAFNNTGFMPLLVPADSFASNSMILIFPSIYLLSPQHVCVSLSFPIVYTPESHCEMVIYLNSHPPEILIRVSLLFPSAPTRFNDGRLAGIQSD